MVSDNVLISLIGAVGAALVAYITSRFRKARPKTAYIDTAFEAYEAIMKRLDAENSRLREENGKLRDELRDASNEKGQ